MKRADLDLTDSGGVQEEAPALAKPVLVLCNRTECPQAVDAGVAMLVETDTDQTATTVYPLLSLSDIYRRIASGGSTYGDGTSA